MPTKKIIKKVLTKKPVKKASIKKPAVKKAAKKASKPIGLVTHFYGEIKVAIVKFNKPTKVGVEVCFVGHGVDFSQKIVSMQFDHAPVMTAKKGQEVGIKVAKKLKAGTEVFAA